MALDRQINLFKVDTNAFLTLDEKAHKEYLVKCKKLRDLIFKSKKINGREKDINQTHKSLLKRQEDKLNKYELVFIKLNKIIKEEEKKWKSYILDSAAKAVKYNNENPDNKHIRELDERYLSYIDRNTGEKKVNISNVIAMFESTLSRSFGINQDELSYDIFVLEIFYYDIAQDLIINGFNYNNKHYVYFSSSAGQIRTKKAVFVEETKYEACKKKLMCGLTIDNINAQGGMNINKFLAYLALSNSATDLWEDIFNKPFDIDRCIVVDDFETLIKCKVDDINYETYEITPGATKEIPIPHTDGCGLISSDYCSKNFMVRLPWIKGLLGSFDFKQFVYENLSDTCNGDIKDIWGDTYNIFKDDIQVIFTKSQLKMYKYYSSWDEYKRYFKQYGCEAGICNMEEDEISDAKINYQMLQTLYDATDEEIADLCEIPNQRIKDVSRTLEDSLAFYGVYLDKEYKDSKDYFQEALYIYPELITDPSAKEDLHDLKNSLVKRYKGGHLNVKGKFTFVLPDLYAFCDWLFIGKCNSDYIPKGLLKNNEVFCRLYSSATELDCLRSPHLYIEHAIRKNVCNKESLSYWFDTDAIYTSTYDPISRILQFDVDGDRLLVISQPIIINMAKRVTKDVYPLYYEMKKAKAEIITPDALYNGLKLAFTGGRIGPISNDITKIWNAKEITPQAKDAVRWLCMETNFTIDYAKTLFKPTRPAHVDAILKQYGRDKTPFFFQYAKDKKKEQVEPINNSTMNRIIKEIKENRNMFRPIKNLKNVNYLLMTSLSNKYINNEVNAIFNKWNRKYGNNIKFDSDDTDKNNIPIIAKCIKEELLKIEPEEYKIVDSLVYYFYHKPSTKKKKLLWYVYGEQILNNLKQNITTTPFCHCCGKRTEEELIDGKCYECRQKEIKESGGKRKKCQDCGKVFWIKAKNTKTCRCEDCQHEEKKKYDRKYRQDEKNRISKLTSNL